MTLTSGQEVTDRLHQVYDMTTKRFTLWFPFFWKAVKPYERPPRMNTLHLAAFNGHEQEIHSLLVEDTSDINTADGTSTYPVIRASLNGHDKVVQMLLDHRADVNVQGGDYRNALYIASSKGHDKIMQMLLERGADVNAQGRPYGNALQAASSRIHDKIVRIQLQYSADPGYIMNHLVQL